ncbi:MAG: methylated-DNA--[protein]-cysteine S-methyltransferase [Oscillospiraceae bacterium]|nr:methylated-DNA--[protein]-cysteine S-methyltransferase [Oscillospiraceae bacterium]
MPMAFRETSIGIIGIAEENGMIINLCFNDRKSPRDIKLEETPLIQKAFLQLEEYLNGKRRLFDLPLSPRGTEWQMKCWRALLTIPYGETRSYGEIAAMSGNPKACRAVGLANNRNPIAVFIPCHRVIGKDGSLTGFGGGLDLKEKLLLLEKQNI